MYWTVCALSNVCKHYRYMYIWLIYSDFILIRQRAFILLNIFTVRKDQPTFWQTLMAALQYTQLNYVAMLKLLSTKCIKNRNYVISNAIYKFMKLHMCAVQV